jgi:hypothetical protein
MAIPGFPRASLASLSLYYAWYRLLRSLSSGHMVTTLMSLLILILKQTISS